MSLPFKWELPGGKLDPGETPSECLARETEEELGLKIQVGQPLGSFFRRYNGKKYQMVPFLCEVTGGTLHTYEHEAATWWPLDRWEELDWAPAEREMLGQLLEILKPTRLGQNRKIAVTA